MNFCSYYTEYMGKKENNELVTLSEFRELPIHKKYFYPLIISDFFEKKLCSCKEEYFEICAEVFDGTIESVALIMNKLPGEFRRREFYRYSYNQSVKFETGAITLDRKLIQSINLGHDFNQKKYVESNTVLFDEGRQFLVLVDNNIASRALISDIYAGGANIVVYTFPEYRGKGYAKEVVKACVNWCLDNQVLPVYFVEKENRASISLAENLGFKRQCSEVVIQK